MAEENEIGGLHLAVEDKEGPGKKDDGQTGACTGAVPLSEVQGTQ